MQSCYLGAFLMLFCLVPRFAQELVKSTDEEGLVCKSGGGECIDEEDNEDCEAPMGTLDCPNKKQCCGTETDDEKTGLMWNRHKWRHDTEECLNNGGVCKPSNRCRFVLNETNCYPERSRVCCNTTCAGKKKTICRRAKGHCINKHTSQCEPNEREIENGCRGYHNHLCKCCAPPCNITDLCKLYGGWCVNGKNACYTRIILVGGCIGKGCACCLLGPRCVGISQSPINIVTEDAVDVPVTQLKFHEYNVLPTAMNITNTGYIAEVEAEMSSPATIEGADLKGTYTFEEFHFHWGSADSNGSEHEVNGKKYSSELHIVHFKTEYGSIGDAIEHPDGVAVLAVFLNISENDNNNLSSIINGLANIHEYKSTSSITPFKLQDLLPANVGNFYSYHGSLTIPPWYEVVTWIIFKEPIFISFTQLDTFRELLDEEGQNIVNNTRPVQPLNGRIVYNIDEI